MYNNNNKGIAWRHTGLDVQILIGTSQVPFRQKYIIFVIQDSLRFSKLTDQKIAQFT